MIKDFEQVKKQLMDLSQAVNAFKSEAVQLRIVELLFKSASIDGEASNDDQSQTDVQGKKTKKRRKKKFSPVAPSSSNKKPTKTKSGGGATDVLRQLVTDGYFKNPKQIGEIVDHCKVKLAKSFKANELSPGLLKLVREKVLDRDKDKETSQFKYRSK